MGGANSALLNKFQTWFLGRNDKINRWGNVASSWQLAPGVIGFWPFSAVDRSSGDALDLSGHGYTLTRNAGVQYGIHNDFMPFTRYNGSTQYFSFTDNTDIDVTGTEGFNLEGGGYWGGWFLVDDDTPAAENTFIAKFNPTGNQRSWGLATNQTTGVVSSRVSSDGTLANTHLATGVQITQGTWNFIMGSFNPGVRHSVFIGNEGGFTEYPNTTGVPASIFVSTADLTIGAIHGGDRFLDGQAAIPIFGMNHLSSAYIRAMFEQSRVLFI